MTGKPSVQTEAEKAVALAFWDSIKPMVLPGIKSDLHIAEIEAKLDKIYTLLVAIQTGLEDEA